MKLWKIPPHDAPPADEGTIQAWYRKRQAIYPCVLIGVVLLVAGFFLKNTWAGKLLAVAAAVLAFVVKSLNTSCQTCPQRVYQCSCPKHPSRLYLRALRIYHPRPAITCVN